jgi:hypothetical protein
MRTARVTPCSQLQRTATHGCSFIAQIRIVLTAGRQCLAVGGPGQGCDWAQMSPETAEPETRNGVFAGAHCPDHPPPRRSDGDVAGSLQALQGSSWAARDGRFRQPRGGTCFLAHVRTGKRHATLIFEVPPSSVGHPCWGNPAVPFLSPCQVAGQIGRQLGIT